MKTKYEDCGAKPLKYPVLGVYESTRRIVLFFSKTSGIELYPQILPMKSNWSEDWVVCRGVISITNDAIYDVRGEWE